MNVFQIWCSASSVSTVCGCEILTYLFLASAFNASFVSAVLFCLGSNWFLFFQALLKSITLQVTYKDIEAAVMCRASRQAAGIILMQQTPKKRKSADVLQGTTINHKQTCFYPPVTVCFFSLVFQHLNSALYPRVERPWTENWEPPFLSACSTESNSVAFFLHVC